MNSAFTHQATLLVIVGSLLSWSCGQEQPSERPSSDASPVSERRADPAPRPANSGPMATASSTASAAPSASAASSAAPASPRKKADPDLLACCRAYSRYELCNQTPSCPPGVLALNRKCLALYKKKMSLGEARPQLLQIAKKKLQAPLMAVCDPATYKKK